MMPTPFMLPASAILAALTLLLCGCQSEEKKNEIVWTQTLDGPNAANYAKVFKSPVPPDVVVLRSVVAEGMTRAGQLNVLDYELELLAPRSWVEGRAKPSYAPPGDFMGGDAGARKLGPLRHWYAPGPLSSYETYVELAYIPRWDLLVQKRPVGGGRWRVFIGKRDVSNQGFVKPD